MISGTTPTFRLRIDALDLTQCHGIHVTLRQRNTLLDFANVTISEHLIEVWLSQEQSLRLIPNAPCKIQVNGLTPNGSRWATKTKVIDIDEQLLLEVIE